MSKVDWNLLRNGARRAKNPQYQDVFDRRAAMVEELNRLKADMQQAAKLNLELLQIRRENEEELAQLRARLTACHEDRDFYRAGRDEANKAWEALRNLLQEATLSGATPYWFERVHKVLNSD